MNRQYLSPADVAVLVGKTERTIYRWIKEGIIPSTRLGGSVLIPAKEFDEVLARDRQSATVPLPRGAEGLFRKGGLRAV